jgi:elastase-2
MANIQVNFWSGDAAYCGGTLISRYDILTAAHCLYGAVNTKIILGAHDVTSFNTVTSGNYQQTIDANASSFKIHPDWYYGQTENDIAIIRLPNPVSLNGITIKLNNQNPSVAVI